MFEPSDFGRYLFHYTSASTLVNHILPDVTLRMSPLSLMNDPRESKEWQLSVDLSDQIIDMGVPDVLREFALELKRTAKIVCFTRDDPSHERDPWPTFPGRGFAHPRMWAQYGDRHAGACLVFDIDTLGDEIAASVAHRGELSHVGVGYGADPRRDARTFMVSATDVARHGVQAAARRHRDVHHGGLYFVKDLDWAAECEYRWVLLSDHDEEFEYLSVSNSLAGIIFGPDCSDANITMSKEMLAGLSLSYARLQYHNGTILVDTTI